jgi:hypothetical protein
MNLHVHPFPYMETSAVASSYTFDAVNEYSHYIGQVVWADGSASKTFSSSGGKVRFRNGNTNTFANAGTTFRIGIQGVDTTTGPARGDTTWAVYGDYVGGSFSITNAAANDYPMTSGSMTLSRGQLIAVVAHLSARGGTDQVMIIPGISGVSGYGSMAPMVTTQSPGGTFSDQGVLPNLLLIADDGTFGWFAGTGFIEDGSTATFDSGNATADEYGNVFTYPFEIDVMGFYWAGRYSAAGAAAKVKFRLYLDPLGTPTSVLEKEHWNYWAMGTASGSLDHNVMIFPGTYTIPANTPFALAAQPQDASSDILMYWQIDPAVDSMVPFGASVQRCRRLNNTGAFTTASDMILLMDPIVSRIEGSNAFLRGRAR